MEHFKKINIYVRAERFFIDVMPWPRGVIRTTVSNKTRFVAFTYKGEEVIREGDWMVYDGKDVFKMSDEEFNKRYVPAGLSNVEVTCKYCGAKLLTSKGVSRITKCLKCGKMITYKSRE